MFGHHQKTHFAVKTDSGTTYYIERFAEQGNYWAIYINGEQKPIIALVDATGKVAPQWLTSDVPIQGAIAQKLILGQQQINTPQDFVGKAIFFCKLGTGLPTPSAQGFSQKEGNTGRIAEIVFFK